MAADPSVVMVTMVYQKAAGMLLKVVPVTFLASEGGSRYILLGVEHDRREDDDGHGEREDEKTELAGTAL